MQNQHDTGKWDYETLILDEWGYLTCSFFGNITVIPQPLEA